MPSRLLKNIPNTKAIVTLVSNPTQAKPPVSQMTSNRAAMPPLEASVKMVAHFLAGFPRGPLGTIPATPASGSNRRRAPETGYWPTLGGGGGGTFAAW